MKTFLDLLSPPCPPAALGFPFVGTNIEATAYPALLEVLAEADGLECRPEPERSLQRRLGALRFRTLGRVRRIHTEGLPSEQVMGWVEQSRAWSSPIRHDLWRALRGPGLVENNAPHRTPFRTAQWECLLRTQDGLVAVGEEPPLAMVPDIRRFPEGIGRPYARPLEPGELVMESQAKRYRSMLLTHLEGSLVPVPALGRLGALQRGLLDAVLLQQGDRVGYLGHEVAHMRSETEPGDPADTLFPDRSCTRTTELDPRLVGQPDQPERVAPARRPSLFPEALHEDLRLAGWTDDEIHDTRFFAAFLARQRLSSEFVVCRFPAWSHQVVIAAPSDERVRFELERVKAKLIETGSWAALASRPHPGWCSLTPLAMSALGAVRFLDRWQTGLRLVCTDEAHVC